MNTVLQNDWSRSVFFALVATGALACSEPYAPAAAAPDPAGPPLAAGTSVPSVCSLGGLSVVEQGTGATFTQLEYSFTAVKGEELDVEIDYANGAGFLEFEIDEEGLDRYPDGTPFEQGDSVEITISIDQDCFLVTFAPAGLTFHEAELTINYGNGVYEGPESDLRMYLQEADGDPWTEVGGAPNTVFDVIEAEIGGFSRYALAF